MVSGQDAKEAARTLTRSASEGELGSASRLAPPRLRFGLVSGPIINRTAHFPNPDLQRKRFARELPFVARQFVHVMKELRVARPL